MRQISEWIITLVALLFIFPVYSIVATAAEKVSALLLPKDIAWLFLLDIPVRL